MLINLFRKKLFLFNFLNLQYCSICLFFIILCLFFSYSIYAEEIYHPADINQDWEITQQEFNDYNNAWKQRKTWSIEPYNIPVQYLTRAGYIVTSGGGYHWDKANIPYCWKKGKILKPFDTFTNSIGMTFVLLPSGSFKMGSPTNEPGRYSNEDQHDVILTNNFFMQTTEITQGQWKSIMGTNPSYFSNCGDNCPVEEISWNDVQDFISKLNQKENTSIYRLPTEAEWEYAARAETTTPFAFGNCLDTDHANYDGNYPLDDCSKGIYRAKTIPVGNLQKNNWGLYDMHGNLWEWCQDWYGSYPTTIVTDPMGATSGTSRLLRGGSWIIHARYCRSANRSSLTPVNRFKLYGARLAASSVQ